VVQTPAGERYTRDGGFQINNQGQLVTAGGNPVLGTSGPIVFQPTDKQINIASDGNVTVSRAPAASTRCAASCGWHPSPTPRRW
jgi:Flagellar basal body rod protein